MKYLRAIGFSVKIESSVLASAKKSGELLRGAGENCVGRENNCGRREENRVAREKDDCEFIPPVSGPCWMLNARGLFLFFFGAQRRSHGDLEKTRLRMKSWLSNFSPENSMHAHINCVPRRNQVRDVKGDVKDRPPFAQPSKILTIKRSILRKIYGSVAPIAAICALAHCSETLYFSRVPFPIYRTSASARSNSGEILVIQCTRKIKMNHFRAAKPH